MAISDVIDRFSLPDIGLTVVHADAEYFSEPSYVVETQVVELIPSVAGEPIVFSAVSDALATLPWMPVIVAAVTAFVIGMVWYGFLFRKHWMRLAGKPADEKTNISALIVQFAALIIFSCFVGLISLFSATPVLLLAVFSMAFVASVLAGEMFAGTDNCRAMKLWAIHAGYYTISFTVMAYIIMHF